MVAHAYNPNTQETGARGSRVWDQTKLIGRPGVKTNQTEKPQYFFCLRNKKPEMALLVTLQSVLTNDLNFTYFCYLRF